MSLGREMEFDNAFVFKFSPRKHTPASGMDDQVPLEVIGERHGRMLKLINEIGSRKHQRYVGETVPILVEGPSRRNSNRLEGRTRSNKIVVFEGTDQHRAHLLDVRIIRAGNFTLYGEPAANNGD